MRELAPTTFMAGLALLGPAQQKELAQPRVGLLVAALVLLLLLVPVPRACDAVRTASKSKKKPPTTSSDGHESHRWREGAAAPRDAEIAPPKLLLLLRPPPKRLELPPPRRRDAMVPPCCGAGCVWERLVFYMCPVRVARTRSARTGKLAVPTRWRRMRSCKALCAPWLLTNG